MARASLAVFPSGSNVRRASATRSASVGQKGEEDLRGALRGYLKTITRKIHSGYTYPRTAKRARLEGRVVVKITINASGQVTDVELAETSGHEVLDKKLK